MSLRKRIAFSVALTAIPLFVGGGFWLYSSLSHVPLFYVEALAATGPELHQSNREMLQRTAALTNDLKRPGEWRALFTDRQINGWLAVDVPKNHPDLLPTEVQHPRVRITPERVFVAARFEGNVSAVVSLEFDVSLTANNVVAIRLHKTRVGDIPWRLDRIVDEASRAAHQWGLVVKQTQSDGDPVLLVTLPPDTQHREVLLDRLELRDGAVFLSGRSGTAGRP